MSNPDGPTPRPSIAAPLSLVRLAVRGYVAHEVPRYFLSAGAVLAVMLLVPELLNNMILTAAMLLLGVAIIPEVLRKRL